MMLTVVKIAPRREWANPNLDDALFRLARHGHIVRTSHQDQPIDLVRNRECLRFRDEDYTDAILMLDADMEWIPETQGILSVPAQVAWCPYIGQTGKLEHDGASCGCLRITKAALHTIPVPWFRVTLSDDGFSKLSCECEHFQKQCSEAGIEPVSIGAIGHQTMMVAKPSEHGLVMTRSILNRNERD